MVAAAQAAAEMEESKGPLPKPNNFMAQEESKDELARQLDEIDRMDFEGVDFRREDSINIADYSIMLEHKQSKQKSMRGES